MSSMKLWFSVIVVAVLAILLLLWELLGLLRDSFIDIRIKQGDDYVKNMRYRLLLKN